MGAEPAVYAAAVSYIRISFIGMVFVFIYMVFQSLMRGVGDVKTPMYIVFGAVLLNLIFDPLFIFGYGFVPAFGVAGAAVATIGTQGLAAIIGLAILLSGRHQLHLQLNDLKLDVALFKKMFRLGLPASIEQSTRALGMTVMTFLVASFGTLTLAAYGIGSRILSFVIIPALGFSMATSTLVGQNIGAASDQTERNSLFCHEGYGLRHLLGTERLEQPGSAAADAGRRESFKERSLITGAASLQRIGQSHRCSPLP